MRRSLRMMNSAMMVILVLALLGKATSITSTGVTVLVDPETVLNQTQSQLEQRFSEQRLFPNITFTVNGTIIGWKFAATKGTGGALPELSIWRPKNSELTTYERVAQESLDECVLSRVVLESGDVVYIHESGPGSPGVPVQERDILGLLWRTERVADFVPYLYEPIVDGSGELMEFQSYFISRQGPRDSQLSLQNLAMDSLVPLLSLEICVTSDDGSGLNVCTGNMTLRRTENCILEEITTALPSTTSSTDEEVITTEGDTGGDDLLSSGLLTVIIAVPVAVIVALIMCLLVVCGVVCCVRMSRRRKSHSIYTSTDIPMDDIPNGGAAAIVARSPEVRIYEDPSVPQLQHMPSFAASVRLTNEIYEGGGSSNGAYTHPQNGGPSLSAQGAGLSQVSTNEFNDSAPPPPRHNGNVANYEEPVISLSQYETIENGHTYDSIVQAAPRLTPRALTPLTEIPHIPSIAHSPLPPTPDSLAFYHTLETSHLSPSLGLSTVVTHTSSRLRGDPTPQHSPQTTPRGSPRGSPPHNDNSSSPRSSPRSSPQPRSRLNSLGLRKKRGVSQNDVSSLDVPDPFFKLETGVYVPTKEQRSQFSYFPVFDDNIYASLRKAQNSPVVNNWSFFEEAEIYWRPASKASVLYEQLSSRKYREIHRKQIEITEHLGSGEFGTVNKGVWHTEQGDLDIAVKMLNCKADENDTVRFLQEAAIMGQFRHPNIVRLHGVVTVGEPVMVILELMHNGNLRNYTKSLRPVPGELPPTDLPEKLLDFCSQIALGMEYLSRKEFVHRDLAARNILLTDENVCKIADFGMSRDLDDDSYYISNGGKIPIKWTAPEAIHYRKYSSASDVWSFGILLYEIWSLGLTPYKQKTQEEAVSLVDSGYRIPPPAGCPRALYQLMIDCWHPFYSKRPSFTKVVQVLSQSHSVLLTWNLDDSSVHPQSSSLGAPLEAGENLYPDLQTAYTEKDHE